MCVKHLRDCPEFVAGDGSILRELLHPAKASLQIRYSLAHATVPPGHATKPHRLKAAEVYYIMAGQGLMHIGEASFEIGPECTVYIRPESVQHIENAGRGPLKFLCIVDPAWRQEDEELLGSR